MSAIQEVTGPVWRTDSAAGKRRQWMKKMIVLMVAFVYVVTAVVPSFAGDLVSGGPSDPYDGRCLGDIDADGRVEPSDARSILRMSKGLEPFLETENGLGAPASRIVDVNGDGAVSGADVILVLYIAGGQEPLQKIKQTGTAESEEGISWDIVTDEKQTEKPTEPQTAGQTEQATEKKTEKTTEKQTEKATEKQTEKATEKQTEKTTEKQTEKKTEKATEKQTVKPTEKQTANDYVSEQKLKIGTYNIGLYSYGTSPGVGRRGYRLETEIPDTDETKAKKEALYAKKTGQVKRFFESQGFDILGLQENMISFTRKLSDGVYVNNDAIKSTELFLEPVFPYVFVHSYGCGLVLCSCYAMSEKKNRLYATKYNDSQCYYQSCVIYPNGKRFVLVNTHLQPVKGEEGSAEYAASVAAQVGQMAELIELFADESNVIVFADWNRRYGDFSVMTNAGYTMLNGCDHPIEPSCRQSWKRPTVNTVAEMDPALYSEYVYGGHEEGYEWGARYVYENGAWVKNLNPDGNESDRYLDNIAVKGNITGTGHVVDILGDSMSDHLPFVAEIVIR